MKVYTSKFETSYVCAEIEVKFESPRMYHIISKIKYQGVKKMSLVAHCVNLTSHLT